MLTLENISMTVKTETGETKEILKDVSFTIDSPFTVITGPNGGGKSTTAKIIAGIYRPDSGRILWNGEDITDLSITERAKLGIGFAFQAPVKFKGITVKDLLNMASGKELNVSEACAYLSSVGCRHQSATCRAMRSARGSDASAPCEAECEAASTRPPASQTEWQPIDTQGWPP